MSNEHEPSTKGEVRELIEGILDDVRALVTQQLTLFRHELTAELHRARAAALFVAAGLAVVLVGCALLSLMLVHLVALLLPGLPLWACYGIVGIPLASLGGAACLLGIRKFSRHNAAEAIASALQIEETLDA